MHAFVMFANECLGHLGYEATAPAISMASLMIIFMIDFIGVRAMTKKFDQTSPSGTVVGHSPGKENDLGHGHDHDFSQMAAIATDGRDRRAHWEVQLLEAGICVSIDSSC
jgi:zinc transporter 1/2/3